MPASLQGMNRNALLRAYAEPDFAIEMKDYLKRDFSLHKYYLCDLHRSEEFRPHIERITRVLTGWYNPLDFYHNGNTEWTSFIFSISTPENRKSFSKIIDFDNEGIVFEKIFDKYGHDLCITNPNNVISFIYYYASVTDLSGYFKYAKCFKGEINKDELRELGVNELRIDELLTAFTK